jgi:Ca2+/Na+ antiporter
LRQLLKFACFLLFPFLAVDVITSNIFGCCFMILQFFLFMFLFESSVSFIFRIDSLATRETIIVVLFCLFSSFYCFLSHIYIWIALPSWFYLVLVSVSQEPQEGETRGVRILRVFERNTSDVRIIFFTTNQFLQELSCQIKTTHHPIPRENLRSKCKP